MPVPEVRRMADALVRVTSADMVVTATTARPESLVHDSSCPVVLVPAGAAGDRLEHIGVACDGSSASRAAVAFAREIAAAPRSPVRRLDLVVVEPPGLRYRLELHDPGLFVKEPSPTVTWLENVASEPAGSAHVSVVQRDGDPAAVLCELAERWDLLIMGSRGRGPLRTLLLGSTSAQVARRAPCAVMIVPRVPHGTPPAREHRRLERRVAEALRERRSSRP